MDTQATLERAAPVTAGAAPAALGTAFGGGYYAGLIRVDDVFQALIVAPKFEGEHDDSAWNGARKKVAGARSFYDGRTNTDAMTKAGSKLAQWARALRIGGFDDWYLPSRDELELCYRAFKPSAYDNYCRSGDNPSSLPVGYAYAPDAPAQTGIEAFRDGNAEAFETTWYWSSTQYAGDDEYAWCQDFSTGGQYYYPKDLELRARAVRRVPI